MFKGDIIPFPSMKWILLPSEDTHMPGGRDNGNGANRLDRTSMESNTFLPFCLWVKNVPAKKKWRPNY